MTLTRYKLGDLIEQIDDRNSDDKYGLDDVRGISIQKVFINTKANMQGVPLRPYKIVKPGSFAYVTVTSRNGEKITLAHNTTDDAYIVSTSYVVFKITNSDKILPNYLYMYFNRPEFDRYARFNSWGSARETFTWEDMCDIEIDLPSIEIQKKYVAIYKSMVNNQKCYERGLDDLKLICGAYIEELRRNNKPERVGPYLELRRNKNNDSAIEEVYGVSTSLTFIAASSTVDKSNLSNYKIVEKNDIAYVPTTHMKVWAAAISNDDSPFVVSPIYEVFRSKDTTKLNPEYFFLWLCRDETIRYAFYNSWGSARENFVYEDLCDIEIPIPDIKIQDSIANIFKSYSERRAINEKLKNQIKDVCPILIKGSLEEANK